MQGLAAAAAAVEEEGGARGWRVKVARETWRVLVLPFWV